jgi:twitching motility protein PilJ
MVDKNTRSGVLDRKVLKMAGRRKIRAKLIWSFMTLIVLILTVIAITLWSQSSVQKTINELVLVDGKIARLSLETQKTLRLMQGYEKDFLLQYQKTGIARAKELYLAPFIDSGIEAHQSLAEIQELAAAPQDVDAAQSAMDAVKEYNSVFVGTVNILEQRLDETSGELVKLQQSLDVLGDAVMAARSSSQQDAVKRAETLIQSFVDYAVQNETASLADMEQRASKVMQGVVALGLVAMLIGVFMTIRLSRGVTVQVNHITGLLHEIGRGNFQARSAVVTNDELGVIAAGLNAMLDNITVLIQSQEERDTIQESIMKLLEEISALSDGDFTIRAEVTEDMTGAIADSFNAMADQFSDIIRQVKTATESVDVTTGQVTRQTMGLAEKNIAQVKGVTAAVEAIEEMVASIRQVADNALQSASVSRKSRQNAQEGAQAVSQTSKAMVEIREQINETARSIKRLGESSLEIGNIVQIIDDIADRTSILALNASIQAAMAGEAGHGFAVVADEVQRLADSSSNSTKQIELLIKSIQTEIKDVTNRIDESIGKVVHGSKLADGAHDKLQEIEDVANQLAQLIEAITEATTNQVKMSETIAKTMEDVGEVSRESSLSSQDTATSMNVLSKTARDLRSAVEVFRIGDSQA